MKKNVTAICVVFSLFLTAMVFGQSSPAGSPVQNQTVKNSQHKVQPVKAVSGIITKSIAITDYGAYSGLLTSWSAAASAQGYSITLMSNAFLDSYSEMMNYDMIIYSLGTSVNQLTTLRKENIVNFIKAGKVFYLQCEYLTTFETTVFFDQLVDSLGGSFSWTGTVGGDLKPTTIHDAFATTPNEIASLNYHWYGVAGVADNVIVHPFLSNLGNDIGFYVTPSNPSYGKVVTSTDQDWVISTATSYGAPLLENILYLLLNDLALPVELSSFTHSLQNNQIVLKWETASETNNAGWEIEIRADRKPETGDWKNIGFVGGKGTTTEKQNYTFTVSGLPSSVFEFKFRLKQIDHDGKFSYSKVLTYNPSENGKSREFDLIGNYPNPFNPETKIVFSLGKASRVKVVISNILGQQIAVLADQEFGASSRIEIPFKATNLASGLYFYSVTSGDQKLTRSMLLSK